MGTAKEARSFEDFQALLPIRGKILNVQKASGLRHAQERRVRLDRPNHRCRNACGRITERWRPTQPKPSAAAASCCSRGIDWTAPRVASATWALPQRMSAIAVAVSGPNSSDG